VKNLPRGMRRKRRESRKKSYEDEDLLSYDDVGAMEYIEELEEDYDEYDIDDEFEDE